ncbi:Ig-like domain-containing protein [Ruminococcus sp. LCP21S3_E8]
MNIETEKVESTHNVTEFVADNYNSYIRSIGVDSKGRIYLTTFDGLKSEKKYTIHLLSKDYKELSSADMEDDCFEYYGFDSSNGNFYFESYKTAKSQWGSSSGYRTLAFGNVTNNKITVSDEILDILYAKYVQYHYSSAIMLTEGTLAWTSSYNSTVNVLDSSKFDTKNPNNLPLLGSLSRIGYEGDDGFYSNIGARAVHNNLNNTTVIYMNDNRLMEFDSNYKHISTINTEYPVFALLNYGDDILAIEKDTDSNYYVEKFTWEFPTEINLSQTSATIKVGKSLSLSATSNALATYSYSWSSSNDKIASVTSEGKVYGNSVGTAVITAKTTNGVTAQCTVTVEKNSSAPAVDKVKLSGKTSSNISKNDYYKWSSVITSNLSENADGTLNRVESTSNGVLVEKYSSDGKTQTPTVTVKDSKKKTLKNKTDYTVTYSRGRKNVGRYSVKVKFKGNYSGEKTFYYNIAPKSTSVKSVKGLSKAIRVNLNLQKTQTTGYQIQYSTFKNFKNAKTVTVKNTVSAKKITKLKAKKKYFVRVRTYKTTKFSGKNYNIYSS